MAINRNDVARLKWLTVLAACCLTMLCLVVSPADAATLTWGTTGTGGSGTWTATSGWWNGTTQQTWSNATPDDAVFGGGAGDAGGTITLTGGTTTANSVTFNTFTGTYTIGTASQALALNGGGITLNAGAGAVTIQISPITLGAAQSWTNNSTSLFTVSSNITNGGNLLTVTGSGSTTLSSAIAGLGGLTKSGAGTLTLSASSSYSGSTTANGGLITSSARGSFGTGTISINAAAIVRLTGTASSYYSDGYQNTVAGSGGLEIVGQSGSTSVNYSGDLSAFTGTVTATAASGFYVGFGNVSSPSLNVTGSNAKFVVSGAGTFVPVINTSGTIAMGELSGNGNISSAYQQNATYVIGNLATSSTFSGVIKQNAAVTSLVKVGSGTLTLAGINTYSGTTTVNGGLLTSPSNTGTTVGLFSFGTGPIAIGSSGTLRMTGANGLSGLNLYYANGYTNTVSGSGTLQLVGQSANFGVNLSGDLSGFTGIVSATAASTFYVGIGNTASEAIRLSGSNTRFVVSGAGILLPVTGTTGTTLATIALGELSGDGVISSKYGVDSTWQVGALSTSSTFSGRFQDSLNGSVGKTSLIKVGSGALTLSASSSYTGATMISGGRLAIGSSGQINGTSGITINGVGAELKYNSATALTKAITFTQGTLSGTGSINTSVTVGSGAIHSPGNSPGIQTVANETWGSGGTYLWEINDWNGTAGNVSNGFDQIAVTGTLNVAATNLSNFTIAITGLNGSNAVGVVPNFSNAARKTFTIATSGSLTGFAANKFTLDTSSFTGSNSLNNGGFTIGNSGNDVVLNYIPSAVYNLSANATATAIRVGGTSTITATITSSTASVTNPDSLAYTGLSLPYGLGTVSASGTLTGGANASGSAAFTTLTTGSYTFTPAITSGSNVSINTAANAGSTSAATVLVYNPASANTLSTVSLGNIRANGTFGTQQLSIWNTGTASATFQEGLAASISGTSGDASGSGSFGNLFASSTSKAISVGLAGANTATGGVRSGTVTLGFTSTGTTNGGATGLSPLSLASQTVAVTGTVWNIAVGSVTSGTSVNLGVIHAGGSFSGTSVAITNAAPAGGFSEGLNAAVTGTGGVATFGGTSISNLGVGSSSSSITVNLGDTATAGLKNGTITIGYQSNGSTTSGLDTISAGSQTVSLTGGVFSGNGIWSGTSGGSWGMGASSNWTSDEGVAAAPGTFAGYANTDAATFAGAVTGGTATINLTGVTPSLKTITFNTGSASYLLSGGAIAMSSNSGTAGLNVLTGTHEIASNLSLTSLTAVDIATNYLLTLSGTINGSGGFVKTGGGELDLKAANSFTGNTAINAGILKIFNASTFGSGTVTLASGATLNLNNLSIGNTLVNLGGTIINSGSYTGTQTVSGSATFTGSTAGTIDVTTGGNASFAGTVSGTVGIGAGASGNFSGGVTGNVNVAGSAVVTSTVGSGASLGIAAGGGLTFGNGATVNGAASISNNGQLIVDRSPGTALQIAAGISGSGSLMVNSGVVQLTGASNYTGLTSVSGSGSLLTVNGSLTNTSGVEIGTGAMLGGSGVIDAALTGSGLVSPGNSPGIMTASQFDPTGGLGAAFEFTALSPNYASATGSLNDVLRLTNAVNPFASGTFTAANVIDVYFNADSITSGQIYEGGFFTEISAASLLAALDGKATFHYWAMTTGTSFDRSFNGSNYVSLASLPGITGATLQTSYGSKNFGDSVGSVTGSVTQFVIVPEPGAFALAGCGVALAGWIVTRRKRRR